MSVLFDPDERNDSRRSVPIAGFPLPEAQIERLRELAAAYAAGPTVYEIGNLVMVRKGVNMRGVGLPAIIIEIGDRTPDFSQSSDSTFYGGCRDLRILRFENHDNVVPFWVQAHEVEPYVAPSGT